MNIVLIDGCGAGLCKSVIKKIRLEIGSSVNITALGTNPVAALNMLKAGADSSIHGRDAVCDYLKRFKFDCIIGPIGILCPQGINGEITAAIAEAVFKADCTKYIIPLQKHGLYIPGTTNLKIKDIINEIVDDIKSKIKENDNFTI